MNVKKKIAVIMTVHNRKEETLNCLENLFTARDVASDKFSISVFMTDDGSEDGVANEVINKYSNEKITIVHGNGTLYWAGGTRAAWMTALNDSDNYEVFLLLNNDTYLFPDCFCEYAETDAWGIKEYGTHPICVGSACKDQNRNYKTYGDINEEIGCQRDGRFKSCKSANANILFVPKEAVDKFGVIHRLYIHNYADLDYTLWAANHGYNNVLMRGFSGICINDHIDYMKGQIQSLIKMNIAQRIKELRNPKRLCFRDCCVFNMRFHPWRLPVVFFGAILKCFFPQIYMHLDKIRKKYI